MTSNLRKRARIALTVAICGVAVFRPSASGNTTRHTVDACPVRPLVTNTNDSGTGSLRQAIADACATDTITFAIPGAGPDTIVLASTLFIAKNLTIDGPAARSLRLSGGGAVGIADVGAGSDVTFNHLTFTGGAGLNGGAISSSGGLTILNSTLSGNSSSGGGGAIGALGGWLRIHNTTVSGNTAPDQGGAIRTLVPTALVNATVTANAGSHAIAYSGILSLQNSIVAGNATGDLVDEGGTLLIFGSNLLGCDPKLGPLKDNGGPTFTHLPLATSAALDGGDNAAAAAAGLTTDQRGVARTLAGPGAPTGRVDIGAAEAR